MKVVVTGSRSWTSEAIIGLRLRQLPSGSIIHHGDARGADRIAGELAKQLGLTVVVHPAKWKTHGGCSCRDKTEGSTCRFAGLRRNREMLDLKPDLVLAFWDGYSNGTKDCVGEARRRGIAVEVERNL